MKLSGQGAMSDEEADQHKEWLAQEPKRQKLEAQKQRIQTEILAKALNDRHS